MAVVPVGHAADERILVRLLGQLGKELADADAADVCLDRGVERAAVVLSGLGLGIESIDVAGTAPEPDLDDRLGLADGGFVCGVNAERFHQEDTRTAVNAAAQGFATVQRHAPERGHRAMEIAVEGGG